MRSRRPDERSSRAQEPAACERATERDTLHACDVSARLLESSVTGTVRGERARPGVSRRGAQASEDGEERLTTDDDGNVRAANGRAHLGSRAEEVVGGENGCLPRTRGGRARGQALPTRPTGRGARARLSRRKQALKLTAGLALARPRRIQASRAGIGRRPMAGREEDGRVGDDLDGSLDGCGTRGVASRSLAAVTLETEAQSQQVREGEVKQAGQHPRSASSGWAGRTTGRAGSRGTHSSSQRRLTNLAVRRRQCGRA